MTNQMSYLATLASATRLCSDQNCPERYLGRFEDPRPICEECGGTGRVWLIPGLRVECDGYTLFDDMERSVPDALFASTIRRLKSYKGVSDANKS